MLIVKEIPVPLDSRHELVKHDVLPNHEFSIGIVAPKGSGKTTLICNLLNYYKGYFHTIIVFSPTVNNDEKWDWVKKQSLLAENKRLKKVLMKIKNKQQKKKLENPVVGPPPTEGVPEEMEPDEFSPFIPEECFMADYQEEDLQQIVQEQQKLIDFLKKNGFTKHSANRVLLLFDDLVGSNLFSGARKNPFKMLNTNHRHLSCSLMMVSQAFKEIPKTVRTQFSCLVLFEILSDGELEAIYNEFPMGLKKDQWLEMYTEATHGDHDFLFYNMQKPKRLRLMKNFNKVLFFAYFFLFQEFFNFSSNGSFLIIENQIFKSKE